MNQHYSSLLNSSSSD